jgi:hypothetical protein
MAFEQATIKVEKEREFADLRAALDRAFSAELVNGYLKKLDRQKIRVRDWDVVLAKNLIDVSIGARRGTAMGLYQSLTVSDQAQMRELYLFKVEEVDQELRAKFNKVYQYY